MFFDLSSDNEESGFIFERLMSQCFHSEGIQIQDSSSLGITSSLITIGPGANRIYALSNTALYGSTSEVLSYYLVDSMLYTDASLPGLAEKSCTWVRNKLIPFNDAYSTRLVLEGMWYRDANSRKILEGIRSQEE